MSHTATSTAAQEPAPEQLVAGSAGAPANGVRAGERDDLLVVEAHAVEHVADVGRALRAVGQAPVGGAVLAVRVVRAPGPPRDVRAWIKVFILGYQSFLGFSGYWLQGFKRLIQYWRLSMLRELCVIIVSK